MSISASLDVRFTDEQNPSSAILAALLSAGWGLAERGELQVALTDVGDWESRVLTEADATVAELDRCWERRRDCAIALFWRNEEVGGQCLFHSNRRAISFLATVNRRTLPNSELTDASWYIERIVGPLRASGIEVASFRWEEIA